jgi:hypothetical protein
LQTLLGKKQEGDQEMSFDDELERWGGWGDDHDHDHGHGWGDHGHDHDHWGGWGR